MRQVKTAVVSSPAEYSRLREITAAFDWWRDAGIDCDFADEPRNWLAPPEQPRPAEAPPAPTRNPQPEAIPQAGGEQSAWPQNLEAFRAWWLSEPSLDHGRTDQRVAPRGAAGAALLVLVEQPEQGDGERLLGGADGALLEAFLRAAGIAAEEVTCASVLPRHTPHADWARLKAEGMGHVTLHHLALLAPQRIIAFGGNILPLLGHDPTNNAEILLQINQQGASVPVLAARELTALRARPAWKAALWRRWLDWMG